MKTFLLILLMLMQITGAFVAYKIVCIVGIVYKLIIGDEISHSGLYIEYFVFGLCVFIVAFAISAIIAMIIKYGIPLWIELNKKWIKRIIK